MDFEYKYRPPIKYLILGLGGLFVSVIFGLAIGKDELWFSIVTGFFCLIMLAMGIGFLTIFIRKFNVGDLIIGQDFIEIPGRWKNRIRLKLTEIKNIGEFDTYDHIIEIQSPDGIHLIEKQWMKKKDFESLRNKLKEYWEKE